MDWLASPLWNLFYLAWIPVLLAFAYYSRHEVIQKLTLCWLAAFVGTNIVLHTEFEPVWFLVIDAAGAVYAMGFVLRETREPASQVVFALFIAIVGLHLLYDELSWLAHQIGYNALGMAQLAALCIYGKSYGIIARAEADEPRSDLYFRVLVSCRLMT